VQETPREHARRIVEREVPGHQQEQAGNHGPVEGDPPKLAQAPFPAGGTIGTRAPQEHTRLRTAHSIFRRRPQDGQPMYRPAL
jgi:hypothetical protein